MAGPVDDNQESIIEEAVQQFVHAQLRGEEPDIDEFVKKYPGLDSQIRESIQELQKIDTLFDSIVQADESDFEDTGDLVGQKLGDFEIVKMIGRGGMGVVYLARDTKLDRSVAIKSMPAELARDPIVRARFQREAKLLASLSHPNIAVIHDIIKRGEGAGYLVLEYVPGETLAERIARQQLKLKEVLSIGEQIAEAVSAAHDKGVIHRDLKPRNIKLTPDGQVKVLDFGLAKPAGDEAASHDITVTQPGSVIGTPAYMSPEQMRGNPIDRRTDIWSFGCVLYEMLTGKRPFEGKTISDTVAHILEREPDWQALPQETPANIRVLLRRCLKKEPHSRLQHIGDARIEISETLTGVESSAMITAETIGLTKHARWWLGMPWLLVGLMAVVTAVLATIVVKNLTTPPTPSKPAGELVRRFPVILPSSQQLAIDIWASNVALAPDGTSLVYVASERGQNRLYLYNMIDAFAPKPIDGTGGAYNPFFSADGESIAFFAEGKLKKVSLRSGTVLDICTVDVGGRGGCWGSDDTILFTMNPGTGLYRVSAAGGTCESVTSPDSAKGETSHRFPQVLPGGEAVLFTITTQDSSDEWRIAVLSLDAGTWRDLNLRGSNPYYVQTGHLVYAGAAGRLLAAPFDLDRLVVTGSANKVIENVVTHPAAHFCVSANGALVYTPSDVETAKKKTLVWLDPGGPEERPLGLPAVEYDSLRLSHDGQWLAVQIGTAASDCDVYVCELERLVLTRLTFTPSWDVRPRWAPVSNRVTYSSSRSQAPPKLFWVFPDGSGEEQLWEGDPNAPHLPSSWSSDERYLAFVEASEKTQFDIWVLSMEEGRQAQKFLGEPYNEKKPAFHPGGNCIAYVSDETGRYEVYVRRFPGGREKTRVSTDGGNDPMWDPSGQTLYYRSGDKMMAVVIKTEPSFSAGQPKELFRGRYERNEWGTSYDVAITPDGLRFIMIKLNQEESSVMQLNVILNWSEELERLVPIDKE